MKLTNALLKHPRNVGALQKPVCLNNCVFGDHAGTPYAEMMMYVASYTYYSMYLRMDGLVKHICVDRGMECDVQRGIGRRMFANSAEQPSVM